MEKVTTQHAMREPSTDRTEPTSSAILQACGVTIKSIETCALSSKNMGQHTAPPTRRAPLTSWMSYNHIATQPVNLNEMMSLQALIAYVASISGRTEFGIERAFSNHFNIPNTKCLPASDYDAAIRYLVDLVPDVQNSGT